MAVPGWMWVAATVLVAVVAAETMLSGRSSSPARRAVVWAVQCGRDEDNVEAVCD